MCFSCSGTERVIFAVYTSNSSVEPQSHRTYLVSGSIPDNGPFSSSYATEVMLAIGYLTLSLIIASRTLRGFHLRIYASTTRAPLLVVRLTTGGRESSWPSLSKSSGRSHLQSR